MKNALRWLAAVLVPAVAVAVAVAAPGPLFAQVADSPVRGVQRPALSVGKHPATPAAAPAPATNELLVFVGSGSSASALGKQYGLTSLGSLVGDPNILRFQAPSVQAAATAATRLGSDPRVTQAFQLHDIHLAPRSFTPDDPFFFPGQTPPPGGPGDTSNTDFPGQWHLRNQMPASATNDPSINLNVTGAWNRDLTGAGVVIGIVDDAIQVGHPDLATNNQPALSRYFLPDGSMSGDPSPPAGSTSNHGTAVAGLAVARGGNGAGVTGVAPFAGLAGLRTEYDGIALANAYTWHNDSIQIKNHSYGPTAPYDATLAPLAATMTSTATDPAHPAIHVLAAPNGRVVTDGTNFYIGPMADANTDGLNHNPNAITVAAVGSDGFWTDYSSFGANVFVSAPSGSGFGFAGVATTDRTGSDGYNPTANVTDYLDTAYTRTFNGNSAVAPQVSGAIALAVQARNNLGLSTDVRVIKHLLARTSVMVDPTDAFNADSFNSSDGGWRTNAAGFHFNQNYGFGMINVNALTQAATQYSGVTPQVTYSQPTTNVNLAIPDNNTTGISRTFTMSSSPGKLEEVEVHLNITHTYRGDIEAYITSPSGYRSRLVFANEFDSGANIDWTFTTNAFWGEGVNGNWTITVMDLAAADTGTWNSYAVTFYTGDLVPIPEPGAILAIAVGALGLGVGYRRLRRGVTVTPTLAA